MRTTVRVLGGVRPCLPTELRPARSRPGQPGFNPARYTLDLLLPVANLHQREAFVPPRYAAWWAFGLTLAGWLLAAVVVAGPAGAFKRDWRPRRHPGCFWVCFG